VMNTFFVPQLGSMIYTMHGMVTQLHLLASQPGDFYGLSGQLSGDGFSDMYFTLRAVAPDDFTAWVNTVRQSRQSGPVLDRAAYTALLNQSVLPPYTYRAIDPQLFNAVATQQLPPGEGPWTGRPALDVHPLQ
jgi:cytochrome o ubiquinol oxidase subunit 2